jgi:hypothetical protein
MIDLRRFVGDTSLSQWAGQVRPGGESPHPASSHETQAHDSGGALQHVEWGINMRAPDLA